MATEKIQPEAAPSPITAPDTTDEGTPIIPAANVTISDEEGVEPTVEEVGGEQPAQPEQVAQPAKPKNRVPAKQRINQLVHQSRTFESEAQRLAAENADLKAQMATKDTERQQVNEGAMAAHKSSWKNARELARRELIDAKNAQDPAKEADAIARLSRAESELGNIEAWEANQPKKPTAAAQPEQQPQPRQNGNGQQQQVEVSPEIQAWVEQNLWAVNDPRNDQYDSEMANYMAVTAKQIELKMTRQGRAAEIGTAPYFEILDKAMREEFPDRFDDSEEEEVPEPQPQPKPVPAARPANQRQAPQMQRNNGAAVAPASATASQQRPSGQAKTVQLSAEERQFAHQIAANGGLKYPIGHKLAGKQMAPADAEVAYARQKLNIGQR